ncbi:hypothetical protein H1235_00940 [Pseudoxanthomonas sp. NC8]|nr:hypothetical protein H1235_00940 [Pseudoxanthomonas sp. NC8]
MQFVHSLTRVSALAVGIAGVLACGHAHAAAFQLKENSVKAQVVPWPAPLRPRATPRSSSTTRP